MADVPLLAGIYTDGAGDFRTAYPRNLIPVPKPQGINDGYLRPASGILTFGGVTAGKDRGGINWNGICYRVMGNTLVLVRSDGTQLALGVLEVVTGSTTITVAGVPTVVPIISPTPIDQTIIRKQGKQLPPGTDPSTLPAQSVKKLNAFEPVRMEYGADRLAIWANGHLYYWKLGDLTVARVTDADLGRVIDGCWLAGYYLSTDGEFVISTDIQDPLSVNPLRYGSAESDPDDIRALATLRNELYAIGRYTIEVFQNVGGVGVFPFQRIESAQVPRGTIGRKTWAPFLGSFGFVGSAKSEAPGVYLMVPGDTQKLSTREIDMVLASYPEEVMALAVVEARVDRGHNNLCIHLPDQTLVYDDASSRVLKVPVWYTLASSVVGNAAYRARHMVWCYDKWIVGDTLTNGLGVLDETTSDHYGDVVGWEVSTPITYNDGDSAIVGEIELVALTGRCKDGMEPAIWTSHSHDGATWSQERAISAGTRGQRSKRLVWRNQGTIRNWRVQMIRGTSDAHISPIKLAIDFEALYG